MSLNVLKPQLAVSAARKAALLNGYSWRPLILPQSAQTHSPQRTFIGNYASSWLRHLLQVASASSEPSAHSGSPSQRHRAGTHWPFLQVKSVVAHVFFAVEDNITLETPQQQKSWVIFNLLKHFRCNMTWSFVCSEQEDFFDSVEPILKHKSSSTGQSIGVDAPGVFERFGSDCAAAARVGASTVCKRRATSGYVTHDQDSSHPTDDEVFFYDHHNLEVCAEPTSDSKSFFFNHLLSPHMDKHHYAWVLHSKNWEKKKKKTIWAAGKEEALAWTWQQCL